MGKFSMMKRWLMKIRRHLTKSSYSAEELRAMGARIGDHFANYGSIDATHPHLLTIGNEVTLSACRILTHDASTKIPLGYARIGRVEIGDHVFVGADALILPNVKIGSNCIIGACAVVTHDIPDNSVAVGNPARVISTYDEFVRKNKELMENGKVYHTYWTQMTEEDRRVQYEDLKDGGIGFTL